MKRVSGQVMRMVPRKAASSETKSTSWTILSPGTTSTYHASTTSDTSVV
ncbi:MAG: hypothetical protein HYX34_07555 [Actinobacteria bacterium]|nr:hypothetical protein [Actinomycetota bacterium]